MHAVIQKITHAKVNVTNADSRETYGRIDNGFVVLLDITHRDTEADTRCITDKTADLRIFEDETGKSNLSLKDTGGTVLLVSQFMLYTDARNGRHPSCSGTAPAAQADELYRLIVDLLHAHGLHAETGCFQTHIQMNLCNGGPVTLLLDSQKLL